MKKTSIYFRLPIKMGKPRDYIYEFEKEIFLLNKVKLHSVYKTAFMKKRKRDKDNSGKAILLVTDKRIIPLLNYYIENNSEGRNIRRKLLFGKVYIIGGTRRSWFNAYNSNFLSYSADFKEIIEKRIAEKVIPTITKVMETNSRIKGSQLLRKETKTSNNIFNQGAPIRELTPYGWDRVTGYKIIKNVFGKKALFISFEPEISENFYNEIQNDLKPQKDGIFSKMSNIMASIFPTSEFMGYDLEMNQEYMNQIVGLLNAAGIAEIRDENQIKTAESYDQ